MWFIGIALVPAAGFSLWLLRVDALNGSDAVWPVYLFGGVTLACTGVWSYIVAKLNQ